MSGSSIEALLCAADVAHVLGSRGDLSSRPSSVIIHDAASLLWTDGLDALRHLFARQTTGKGFPLDMLNVKSLCDLAWYCEWKEMPNDAVFAAMPRFSMTEVVTSLGVPKTEQEAAIQQLTLKDIPMLQQVVLSRYLSEVVDIIDSQLPGLNIKQLHEQHKLFAR